MILKLVISHFDNYPLQTSKQLDFESFKKAAVFIQAPKGVDNALTEQQFKKVLKIKSSINKMRSDIKRFYFIDRKCFKFYPEWVIGYLQGKEECYKFILRDGKSWDAWYISTSPSLDIAGRYYDVFILIKYKHFLVYGFIKPPIGFDLKTRKLGYTPKYKTLRLVIPEFDYMIEDSIKDLLPIVTRKCSYTLGWCEVENLKNLNWYKTAKGELTEYWLRQIARCWIDLIKDSWPII